MLLSSPAARPCPELWPTTSDALWQGRIVLTQPQRSRGYRFNLDSVLLAGFVRGNAAIDAVDLGAGCGIVGLLLLKCGKAAQVTAVERQPQLLACLWQNVAQNGLQQQLQVAPGDLRQVVLTKVDLVVFNPPYFEAHTGRPSACVGRDEARRECHGSLQNFVAAGANALRPAGRMAAIVPYGRREQFAAACSGQGLHIVRQRSVLAFANSAPRQLLLEAAVGQRSMGVEEQPPWVVHEAGGGYRPDIAALIDGPAPAAWP